MTSRTRSTVLAGIVGLLAVGLLYTKFLGPWLQSQTPTPVAQKSPAQKARKTPNKFPPKSPAPAEKVVEPAPIPVPIAAAPDPRSFGYRGLLFDRLDTDGDKYLVEAEIPARYRQPFLAQDKDANAKIDVVEFQAGIDAGATIPDRETATTPRQVLLTPPPAGNPIPVYTPLTDAPVTLPDWFRGRDRDGDGQLGLYEWPVGSVAEFEKYDGNADGFVTAAEVERQAKGARPEKQSTETKTAATKSTPTVKPMTPKKDRP